jgi:sugar phosphate isomerase/epimerase
MKLSPDTIFVGLTDPAVKHTLYTDKIESNIEVGNFCVPSIINGAWKHTAVQIKKNLKKTPFKCHLHGPFFGLQYDCKDAEIRAVCKKKYERALRVAGMLNAEHVVVHSTFNPLDPHPRAAQVWLKQSADFWKSLIPSARKNNCMLVIENIFDRTPENIIKLINEVDSPYFKGCLDVGHANIFGTISITEWLDAYKKELFHLHLHDNFGKTDDHLAIGSGTVPYDEFFAGLEKVRHVPACTIEVLNADELSKSMDYLRRKDLLES